ncbi:MAG: nitrophenyl compound nitroreductase subunit ArsF family protein [Proteobacteria bacterium]|nr:nitrophenyl compound nitroreductase subunit ArsF family protein [Pseudomonadota bacterium]
MGTIKMLRMIVICFICCMALGSQFINAAEKSQGSQKDTATIMAYYFHGNFRCNNCFTIEQYSKEAIEKYFPEQLKNGKLTFSVINTDMPENEHFIKDYQLYTKSLIVAEFKNGKQVKWTNLEKVWNYINDRDAFYNYVKTEIQKYLAG